MTGSGPWGQAGRAVAPFAAFLVLANAGAWFWAFLAFRGYPVLLETALLAYGLGLRHAVGFWFSLGHSTVVILTAIGVVTGAAVRDGPVWRTVGAVDANFGLIGYLIVGVLAVIWIGSMVLYRVRQYGRAAG